LNAYVSDAAVVTAGPKTYTAFLIRPPEETSKSDWFFVRSNDVSTALERGAAIGLLMGAAEANRWSFDERRHFVNIKYMTEGTRKVIVAASLRARMNADS